MYVENLGKSIYSYIFTSNVYFLFLSLSHYITLDINSFYIFSIHSIQIYCDILNIIYGYAYVYILNFKEDFHFMLNFIHNFSFLFFFFILNMDRTNIFQIILKHHAYLIRFYLHYNNVLKLTFVSRTSI